MVIPPKFEIALDFHDGRALVGERRNDIHRHSFGYIDRAGNIVIPIMYETVSDFSEGYAVVQDCDTDVPRQFFIDRNGIIAFNRIWAHSPFSEGLAGFASEGLIGYIDTEGNVVIEPFPDRALPFSGGMAAVQMEHMAPWGFIDRTGTMVIEPRFFQPAQFRNGLAWVTEYLPPDSRAINAEAKIEGWIDKKGNYVWKQEFDLRD
jgi:hypothetical protein